MKIPVCLSEKDICRCPACHCCQYRKHGKYTRKGFHAPNSAVALRVKVQRYLCLNPHCRRSTFSVLPEGALRYIRFYWPSLLAIGRSLSEGESAYRLARHVWHVARGTIVRAGAFLSSLERWLTGLHQELTDGAGSDSLEAMTQCVSAAIGWFELKNRWYRHRYPRRFCNKMA